MEFIKEVSYKYFVQGVIENPDMQKEDGGLECYREMSLTFKIMVNSIMILSSLYFIQKYHNKVVPKFNPPKNRGQITKQLEIASGLACWSVILIQCYFKISTQTLIYIFNPCHIAIVQ